jgi:hypothetical protein
LLGGYYLFFRFLSFSAVGRPVFLFYRPSIRMETYLYEVSRQPTVNLSIDCRSIYARRMKKNQNQKSLSHHPPPNARSTYSFSSSSCFLFESVHHCDGPLWVLQTIKIVAHYY